MKDIDKLLEIETNETLLHLFATDCAERALARVEKHGIDVDKKSKRAIEASKRAIEAKRNWVYGLETNKQLHIARSTAYRITSAVYVASRSTYPENAPTYALASATYAAAVASSSASANWSAWSSSVAARTTKAHSAKRPAVWAESETSEKEWQIRRLEWLHSVFQLITDPRCLYEHCPLECPEDAKIQWNL